ncbi:MAG: DJ-1/PfpI family protein [Crocinitomicaceae bacterium]|nr:DJ-1/PfpI family protein [Crocinitomicaceae bacterium]
MKLWTVKFSQLIPCLAFFFLACTHQENIEKVVSIEEDTSVYNVAFLVMDGTYNTELTAPYDIFHHTIFRDSIKPMKVFTVANTLDPITTFEGIKILPDHDYTSEQLPRVDILVIPSAEHHLDSDLADEAMLNFVREISETALFVTSHCDGAFVLAEAGVLNGIVSTTFPADVEEYRSRYPELQVKDSVLFVHDGKFITSAGGAKSFEASLYLCELLYGKKNADEIAEGMVIDWQLDSVPHIVVND